MHILSCIILMYEQFYYIFILHYCHMKLEISHFTVTLSLDHQMETMIPKPNLFFKRVHSVSHCQPHGHCQFQQLIKINKVKRITQKPYFCKLSPHRLKKRPLQQQKGQSVRLLFISLNLNVKP